MSVQFSFGNLIKVIPYNVSDKDLREKRLIRFGVVGAVISALLIPSVAYGAESPVERAAKLVESAAPEDLPAAASNADVGRGAINLKSETSSDSLSVPLERDHLIEIQSDNEDGVSSSIGISMPAQADVSKRGKATRSGTAVFAGDDVDVVVEPIEASSVRLNTVLESTESPHAFTYEMDLPRGAKLELQESGAIAVLYKGALIGGVAKPWARDAAGEEITTRYEVKGHSFTQIVDQNESAVYPVVADPWVGKALISKTSWTGYNKKYKGYTLEVYPSQWGRFNVWLWFGPALYGSIRKAFYSEMKSKTPGTREETASMRDQLYCHIDAVRLKDSYKKSWNLDTWRPNVSYARMIRASCNPL